MRYGKVIEYEMWGNSRDGWECNNAFTIGEVGVEAEDGYEAWPKIRKQMIRDGLFPKRNRTIRPDNNCDNSHTIYLVDHAVKVGGYKPVGEIRPLGV